MHFFDSEYDVGPRRVFCLIDGTNAKVGDDVILLDLPDRVLIPHFVQREGAKVRRHHVERLRKTPVNGVRRVSEVMLKKPPHNRFPFKGCGSCLSRIRADLSLQHKRGGWTGIDARSMTNDCGIPRAVHPDDRGGLKAHKTCETE